MLPLPFAFGVRVCKMFAMPQHAEQESETGEGGRETVVAGGNTYKKRPLFPWVNSIFIREKS